MPMGKGLTKNEFDGIKYMLNQGMKINDIAEISGYCGRTVYRVRDSKDYDEYSSMRDGLNTKRRENERRENAIEQNAQHESLNRDMLKAILESMQILAANQSIIASKLDALIQQWK